MQSLVTSICIRRAETGDELAHVRVSQESNGYAVWYQASGHDPRLLGWHGLTPRMGAAGVLGGATGHAHRLARDVIEQGEEAVAHRAFEQSS